MAEKLLLIWGAIGSGKTSLLASSLLGPRARAQLESLVDWPASAHEIHRALMEQHRRLVNGLPTLATQTTDVPLAVQLRLQSGQVVRLQDVAGEWTWNPEKPESHRLLTAADAVLFVGEWDSRENRRQFEVFRSALQTLNNRPHGLAFTKCEMGLEDGHPDWEEAQRLATGQAPSNWWRQAGDWTEDEKHTLERIGPVWPTSAYGFHDGRPACLLDEFGESIPYAVSPRNTTEVLEWFLRLLDN